MAALCWIALTPLRTLAPEPVALGLVAGVAICTSLSDFGRLSLRRQNRQVPQGWFTIYGAERAYALYGLWLGAGLATNVAYGLEYFVFVGAGVLLPFFPALVAGAIFGLGRTALAGPIGLFPRAASAWTGFFLARGGRLPGLSGVIALAIASALVVGRL